MNNARKNLILDAILFLLMIVLPFSGHARWHVYLGGTVVALLVLHLFWHWRQIVAIFRQLVPQPKKQKLVIALFALFSIIMAVLPNYLIDQRPGTGKGERNIIQESQGSGSTQSQDL